MPASHARQESGLALELDLWANKFNMSVHVRSDHHCAHAHRMKYRTDQA